VHANETHRKRLHGVQSIASVDLDWVTSVKVV